MADPLHAEGQMTKKYNLPLSHLDFKYIEKCDSTKELEKIVTVLRSGEEGKYPDLERFAEKRLEELNPKSRTLRKDGPILRASDLSGGDWKSIQEDMKNWTNTMHEHEPEQPSKHPRPTNDIIEADENLPPVRTGNIVLEGKKQKKGEKPKKRVMPRDYKEWDKVNIDAELEKVDAPESKKVPTKSKEVRITPQIDTSGLSEEEKRRKAEREKDKGNEAFRSHDFEESVTYYTRSISLLPNAASFNNRALAYLKLESWDKAIKDCNKVLSFEADNIKAFLRRGTAYKSKKDFKKALIDFQLVLKMEPNNKKAEALLKEVEKELEKEEKTRQEKGGRRMIIEEVESDEEEEEDGVEEGVEHVEVEKPHVNGFSDHTTDSKVESNIITSETPQSESPGKGGEERLSEKIEAAAPLTPEQDDEQTSNPPAPGLDTKDNTSAAVPPHSQCSVSSPLAQSPPAPSHLENISDTSALSAAKSEESSNIPIVSTQSCQPSNEMSSSIKPKEPAAMSSHSSEDRTTAQPVTSNAFERPCLVQKKLPPEVQKLKEEGNQLFRSGQYGEAKLLYAKAIAVLEKDVDQVVNLSILLSNRAACHLKTGNCTEAVKDCKLSLQRVPHSLKALLRRAAAYETLERYGDAYVDYKHVISIDKSTEQAHQGATRCQGSLQSLYGSTTWREKIPPLVFVQPWEIPLIVDEAEAGKADARQSLSQSSPSESKGQPVQDSDSLANVGTNQSQSSSDNSSPTSSSSSTTVPASQTTQTTREQPTPSFDDVKAKGNSFVQKGQYKEAVECYTTCISLRPDQVACYTNRALCFLKLNQATEAVNDCEKALEMEPKNAKALYRRALARKMSLQYKQSLQDLVELLKLEPKNVAAQKEMDAVKKAYKEELEKLKLKKTTEQENKIRKRMKIEEVDDDEEDERPARGKGSEKSKAQIKSRVSSGAKSKGSNNGRAGQGGGSGSSQISSSGSQSPDSLSACQEQPPLAPPIAPRLMKTTPYEFCQAWNSLKPCQGVQPYAEILRQISPADLPSVISNKLDGQMLQIIVKCVHEELVLKGDYDRGYEILNNLCEVPRFSTVSMFMSSKEKKEVSSVLDILLKTSSSAYNSKDIGRLKSSYSVK